MPRPLGAAMFKYAIGKPPEPNDGHFEELLKAVMLDKNFSPAKEIISCYMVGVTHNPAKHDYDGFGLINGKDRPIEVKPTTYWEEGKNRLRMKCAFADYNMERLAKDIAADVRMVVTGFSLERLVYGVAFDFNAPPFQQAMREKTEKLIQKGKGADAPKNHRVIPAPDVRDIMQIKDVEILYPSKDEIGILDVNKDAMTRDTYKFLKQRLDA
ncbi:MAG: hypothetical protein MJE68_26225 [Proteobacteria bacterium]|nr:hypothetical protein [Pseudomonadota bacterium]